MRDKRYDDPWGYLPDNRKRYQKCFECGELTTGRHHVVPVCLGGTKQIPLCKDCHKKVHKSISLSDLVKAALLEKKKKGESLGPPLKIRVEVIDSAIKMRRNGATIRKIADELDLSIGSVHRIVAQINEKVRIDNGTKEN